MNLVKPAGKGVGKSNSSEDAPTIDEDAIFRNASCFGNEDGGKDKDGGISMGRFLSLSRTPKSEVLALARELAALRPA
ncbi:hypothetical protein BN1723_013466 [Verticillium longisporum]|uniref:Uncharacterized protein n=1 Tax=Verticillium longisporum TaxID=100787 RepID=A0A0G4KJK7_VERLO|nr:hypothetical protein BN1708_009679 [Verticillium longisporum]CRK25028.1 hypothetical protein BN1723_013466 [Verticillium longisporum]